MAAWLFTRTPITRWYPLEPIAADLDPVEVAANRQVSSEKLRTEIEYAVRYLDREAHLLATRHQARGHQMMGAK